MRLFLGGVILWCFCNPTSGAWLNDLITPKGLNLGDGFVVHVTDSRQPNTTFLERHSITMDYKGYGVSVSKLPKREAFEVGLYSTRDVEEARGHKDTKFTMLFGFKFLTITAIAFAVISALVLKALIAAKIAAMTTIMLLVSKLFHHHQEKSSHGLPHYVEVESVPDLHADYSELHPAYYHPTSANNYYSYANPNSGIDYGAAVQASATNSTLSSTLGNQQVAKRRDVAKRKRMPLLTIHQYSLKR